MKSQNAKSRDLYSLERSVNQAEVALHMPESGFRSIGSIAARVVRDVERKREGRK